MAGFRLTDGSSGCPPTETPPGNYEIPFRVDDAGRLWITSCFKNLRYFGAARHDLFEQTRLGVSPIPLSTADDIISGAGVTAGTYTNLTVTNTTDCDMGLLLAYDLSVDIEVLGNNLARWVMSGRYNGANHDTIAVSSIRTTGSTTYNRYITACSAAPHDAGIEAGGSPSLVLAPGVSATIGVKIFCQYAVGTPDTFDNVTQSNAAVRVYGYVL